MHREGHLGIGLLLYSPIGYLLMSSNQTIIFALGLVGMCLWSIVPDIDMNLPIKHRGPTHSFVAAAIAGLMTSVLSVYLVSTGISSSGTIIIKSPILAYAAAASFGFLIGGMGVISHLIGDVITPMGVQPWWPFSDRKHGLGLVLAANEQANYTLSILGSLSLAAAITASVLI